MTWGLLKTQLRSQIWPDGEAPTLVASHDKSFLDAIIDIQSHVTCLQQNNTSIFAQCSSHYRCGLTVIDAPRGAFLSLSVIDKINPDTGKEDADSADDYCSEIFYRRVNACHVKSFFKMSSSRGCCLPIPLFFGISGCSKGLYPIPTGAGLPAGLPALPMGFSYPQASTDRTWGRAGSGVWAQEGGSIWIAPWINSTESAILRWNGIKREWADADPIDSDPLLSKAMRLYVQAQHAGEWDHEWIEAQQLEQKYAMALAMLIRQCREETREHDECGGGADEGGSDARAANGVTDLFYNDDQSASITCPAGQTGNAVSVIIPSGTIGSAISKSDANAKAQQQAIDQATAQLVCTDVVITYTNDAQTFTASCGQESGAPAPEGTPTTVTVQAGEVSSTVSKDAANATALALAQSRAESELVCTFWNRAQTSEKICPTNMGITASETVPAHVYSSSVSQEDADAKALNVAVNNANASLVTQGCGVVQYWNTQQIAVSVQQCSFGVPADPPPGSPQHPIPGPCLAAVKVTVPVHTFSSTVSQADANSKALAAGQFLADSTAQQKCNAGLCGNFAVTYHLVVNG